MNYITKDNIATDNDILAADIKNIVDALDGTTARDILITGNLCVTRTTEQLRLGYDANNYTKRVIDSEGSETATSTKDINNITTRYFTFSAAEARFNGLSLYDASFIINNNNATGYFTNLYFARQLSYKWLIGMDNADYFVISERTNSTNKISIAPGTSGNINLCPSGGNVITAGSLTTNLGLQTAGAADSGGTGYKMVRVPN